MVGAGVVCGNVIKGSWRQAYCPEQLLGRVVVSMQFLNYGTMPLGALVGGLLASAVGVRASLWVLLGCVALAPTVLLTGPVRRHGQLPVPVDGRGSGVGQSTGEVGGLAAGGATPKRLWRFALSGV